MSFIRTICLKIVNHRKTIFFIVVTIVFCALLFCLVCLAMFGLWLLQNWGQLSMEEIVYHLRAPIDGTSTSVVRNAILFCGLPALLFTCLLILLWYRLGPSRRRRVFLICGSLLVSVLSCSASFTALWVKLDIGTYLQNRQMTSTFIENNYANPHRISLQFPDKKRNLIYILLESMEASLMDRGHGGGFDRNYIPELTQIAQENASFSNTEELGGMQALPGTGWTMAALFAQSTGLPLSLPIEDNSMSEQESFFPDLLTLGDVLQDNGYQQSFMLGSDATFGGRRLFYTEHGNYDIYDYWYAHTYKWISEDYHVWWGYEDQKLYAFAKQELLKMAENEEPFNFTMLTVDTHSAGGFVCPLCREDNEDSIANVSSCASRQIADFLAWIQQQNFYENTTIVLVGDHLSMNPTLLTDIPLENRTVYNAFINAAATSDHDKNRVFSAMDMYPTILASLGVKISGDRLALGTNLFSNKPTLPEEFGLTTINSELSKRSLFYEQFTRDIISDNE